MPSPMSLFVVATPIGSIQDLSPRARAILAQAELVIGEEAKPARRLLSQAGLAQRPLELLNEHSTAQDVARLTQLCREQMVALVSDCGTPGFCDPGAELVASCRRSGIRVQSVPGPSSLMAMLSVLGCRLQHFVFWGFLPRGHDERASALKGLAREKRPVFLLETPYRLARLLEDLEWAMPQRQLVIGIELSTENERLFSGRATELKKVEWPQKPEFVVFLREH
jgi:16S rRNA (cytidine1402-2'-O)-methyltransferase